jgi:hypothetical protein
LKERKMKSLTLFAFTTTAVAIASVAQAHPGHAGEVGHDHANLFMTGEMLLTAASLFVAAAVVTVLRRRRRVRQQA